MRCKECIYFKPYKNLNPKFGWCNNENFVYSDEVFEREEVLPSNILYYWDYEGYHAYFAVGANFGCIHFTDTRGDNEE
ncbi:MAG: hypothetical protein WCE94_04540 [Candidatus Methanoperedens sp.]